MNGICLEASQRKDITSYSYESLLNDPEGFCKKYIKDNWCHHSSVITQVGHLLLHWKRILKSTVPLLAKKTLGNQRHVHLPEEDLRWTKTSAIE